MTRQDLVDMRALLQQALDSVAVKVVDGVVHIDDKCKTACVLRVWLYMDSLLADSEKDSPQ